MPIYIPFRHEQNIAGKNTFMFNLQNFLDKQGYAYATNYRDADGIFFPISHDVGELREIQARGGKIIQRLDGVAYPAKNGDKTDMLNGALNEVYVNYATHVVFQSEYSKAQVFATFGTKPEEECSIVINGVDKSIFFPNESETKLGERIRFVSTGNFRNIDMLEPMILALDSLQGKFDFELSIVGPIVNPDLEKFTQRDYVKLLGTQTVPEVGGTLRGYDIFIYSHLNPPCPNSVIEAISTGLPVVSFDSGSMSELLYFNTDLLAPVSDDVFQRYTDFNPARLAEKIEMAVNDFEKHKQVTMQNSQLYDFEECGAKYIQVFETA